MIIPIYTNDGGINQRRVYIFLYIQQVWTQKCAVQKASVGVNISYY
jgi:hypothetical protein